MFRFQARAFATDLKAHEVTMSVYEDKEKWKCYKFRERHFFIVSYMHQENIEKSNTCVRMCEECAEEAEERGWDNMTSFWRTVRGYALDH